jgi:ABC-type sugar transport system permease subunit
MEELLNYFGVSFTVSKFLPYLLTILIGVICAKLLSKHLSASKIIRNIFTVLIAILPFGIYFAINPIFQGDFSNEGVLIKKKLELPKNNDLLIIALADCPYCIQSQVTIKLIHKKNTKIKAEYIIMNGTKQDSIRYAEMLKGFATCRTQKNNVVLMQTIHGSFPSYIFVQKGKFKKVWNNDNFGVLAWDELVSSL